MAKCHKCGARIRPNDDYSSSTRIAYNRKNPYKSGETIYICKGCRENKLTKEQLLDNWENGYLQLPDMVTD